jgi:hypothetical protein
MQASLILSEREMECYKYLMVICFKRRRPRPADFLAISCSRWRWGQKSRLRLPAKGLRKKIMNIKTHTYGGALSSTFSLRYKRTMSKGMRLLWRWIVFPLCLLWLGLLGLMAAFNIALHWQPFALIGAGLVLPYVLWAVGYVIYSAWKSEK